MPVTTPRNVRMLSRDARAALLAAAAALVPVAANANVVLNVPNGTTDLTTLGSTSASDLTFTNTAYSATAFTIGGGVTLTAGTLNDLDATQTLSIGPVTANSVNTLSLSGGANGVAPTAADLLYVAAGGTLQINGGTPATSGTLGVTLGASGNLDVAGTAVLNPVLTMGANAITKTGVGTLSLNGVNTGTGGFTVANGTVNVNNAASFGSSTNAITLGSAGNNAAINFTAAANLPAGQAITLAGGSGTRAITNAFAGTPVVAQTVALGGSTLTLASTNAAGNLRLTGVVSGAGAVAVDATNTGTVDLRGASTYAGGTTIAAGTAAATLSSAGAVGAVTSGPLGTGTVTLGSGSTAAALGINGAFTLLNNLTVAAGGTRTLTQLSASSTAGVYSGPVTLNGDLTLSAVTTTLTTGGDRLRLSGAVSGGSNLIVNNANAAVGAVAGSGAVLLSGANGGWTGSLIVQAGQAAIGSNTATSAANAVAVASGGTFNYSAGTFSTTIAGLNNATAAGVSGGNAGGTVQSSATASSRVLTLAGTGTYAFNGTIVNNVNGTNTAGLAINLGTAASSQTLGGASTYSLSTAVTNGKLVLANAAGSATGTSNVALGSLTVGTPTNATLAGTGASSGLLTVVGGARLAPGVNTADADASGRGDFGSAGTLTVGSAGGLTLTSASLDFDLATTAAGTSDLLSTGGTTTYGALAFTFNELAGGLQTGTAYTLLSGAAATSGFDPAAITTAFVGGPAYTPTYSLSGTALQVSFAATPEPAGLALVGVVAGGLLRRVRRGR